MRHNIRRLTSEQLQAAIKAKQDFYRECRIEVPEFMPEVEGIFLGGCVRYGVGSSFYAKAHAHNSRQNAHNYDPYAGWICVRSIKRLGEIHQMAQGDGSTLIVIDKPSRLLYHEYAHVLCPGHGHDDKWRKVMKQLKQPIPKQYQRGIAEWDDLTN